MAAHSPLRLGCGDERAAGCFVNDLIYFGKFVNPAVTANGDPRARVALTRPKTLWFNTGTLCNIECANCYIESSPSNDALVYLTLDDVESFLDQLEERRWSVDEIGFTGGEPFMNPRMIDLARVALSRAYRVLILTNAMAPMMRRAVQRGLLELARDFPDTLTLRVSLDHHTAERHDEERGAGSWARTLAGMRWLRDGGLRMTVAGRAVMAESDAAARAGYAELFAANGFSIDAFDHGDTVIFPEMDASVEVPESCAEKAPRVPPSSPARCCPTTRSSISGTPSRRPSGTFL